MRHNSDMMNVTMTRGQLIDLLVAVTTTQFYSESGGKRWESLYQELKKQLVEFDLEDSE